MKTKPAREPPAAASAPAGRVEGGGLTPPGTLALARASRLGAAGSRDGARPCRLPGPIAPVTGRVGGHSPLHGGCMALPLVLLLRPCAHPASPAWPPGLLKGSRSELCKRNRVGLAFLIMFA